MKQEQNKQLAGAKKKNTLVSGNASDEKNLHLGSYKLFFFLINLNEFFKQSLHLKEQL